MFIKGLVRYELTNTHASAVKGDPTDNINARIDSALLCIDMHKTM